MLESSLTSLFLFTFFILRASPLKHINNPNTPYCFHCCHAGPSSSFEWISARTPCMFFLLKIVTMAFLLKRKSNHVTPAHHFPLYHPPKFLISRTVKKSESYNGLFSPLPTASLITHSFPDSLQSNPTGFLIVPCAHQADFYLRAFALAMPSWSDVLSPDIQF